MLITTDAGRSNGYRTPVAASIVVGGLLIGITCVCLLATSVQNAFNAVVDISGLLFAAFYVLTALATITYYRRRIIYRLWEAILVRILPLGAAGFLIWIIYRSIEQAPASQNWPLSALPPSA